QWVPITASSRQPKPATGEDSFFAETLSTPRTIRSMLPLRTTKELSAADGLGDMVYSEVRIIYEIGDGVSGHPRVAHGGFVSTLMDEAMGVLILLNGDAIVERKKESGLPGPHEPLVCFTAYLNTTYRKPLPAPSVVLCKVKFDRVVRNKIYINATLEDGKGTVFTEAHSMFVSM
ncbi:hypothetical protein DM02DRAFT_503224, partial [Periconia macrospinosa]